LALLLSVGRDATQWVDPAHPHLDWRPALGFEVTREKGCGWTRRGPWHERVARVHRRGAQGGRGRVRPSVVEFAHDAGDVWTSISSALRTSARGSRTSYRCGRVAARRAPATPAAVATHQVRMKSRENVRSDIVIGFERFS
jgi:hypothetical protein